MEHATHATTSQNLEKALEKADGAVEENSDRISIMEEHLRNVQQELKYTQSRVEAKSKEIETEKHLQALAERETVSTLSAQYPMIGWGSGGRIASQARGLHGCTR